MTLTPSSAQVDLLRMPFDQYGRYKIIAEVADAFRAALGVDRLHILDVGGYQVDDRFGERLPLTIFLPHDTIEALDTVDSALPGYHKGDGTAMPFADGAFDLVVSADTLEHISAPLRQKFVQELARVGKHGVALVAPFFSPETELSEIVLQRYMQAELRYKHPFLQEHRDYGLPRVGDIEAWLHENQYVTAVFPSGYVHSWLEMMLLRTLLWRLTEDDALVGAIEEYYNRVLAPLERREPAYRHLIVAAPQVQPRLVDVAWQALAPTLGETSAPASTHVQFVQQFLVQLMPMGVLDRMRGEDEKTVTHWQAEAHKWQVEAHRVELERRALEQTVQSVDQPRRHWESEAHRVELERRSLEVERNTLREQIARLEGEREQWRKIAQRPLLRQLRDRLK